MNDQDRKRKGKMVHISEPLSELMTEVLVRPARHLDAERVADERECMLYAEYSQNGLFVKKVRKDIE
jgi:hypothetical protein